MWREFWDVIKNLQKVNVSEVHHAKYEDLLKGLLLVRLAALRLTPAHRWSEYNTSLLQQPMGSSLTLKPSSQSPATGNQSNQGEGCYKSGLFWEEQHRNLEEALRYRLQELLSTNHCCYVRQQASYAWQ